MKLTAAFLGSLRAVKIVHTVAWAFFATCTIAIPVCAVTHRLGAAVVFIGVVFVEVLILGASDWRCPLTPVAAQYTDDRRDNFDIYLPVWLARYNKEIFGSLYLLGILLTIAAWLHWPRQG